VGLAAALLGMVLGLGSILGVLRGDPGAALRASGNRVQGGRASRRLRSVLVAGQFALAVVLLYGAGLLLRSLARLAEVNPGFEPRGVLTAEISLPGNRYSEPRQLQFFDQLLQTLRRDPSVVAVGAVNFLPFASPGAATGYHPTDRPPPEAGQEHSAAIRVADAGYFPAMEIPLVTGRSFTPADRGDAPPVVLVSRQLASDEWPNQSPLGKRLKVSYGSPDQEVQVVGVVGDVLHDALDGPPRATIYYPQSQLVSGSLTLVLRTRGDPASLAPLINARVRELDPLLPVESMQPLAERLAGSLDSRRSSLVLLGVFAAIALVLAAVGIYGVLSQVVRLRTREIGIRLALGSSPERELRSVLHRSLLLVGLGTAAGLAGAAAASVSLRSFLFDIPAADPLTIGSVLLGLGLTAIVASLIPARRASRVDPAIALRSD
jgi:putative ABC transport system permease protein